MHNPLVIAFVAGAYAAIAPYQRVVIEAVQEVAQPQRPIGCLVAACHAVAWLVAWQLAAYQLILVQIFWHGEVLARHELPRAHLSAILVVKHAPGKGQEQRCGSKREYAQSPHQSIALVVGKPHANHS